MSEEVEIIAIDKVAEEVPSLPPLYELFFNDNFDPDYMETFFGEIHKLPACSNLLIWINSNGGSIHAGIMLKEKIESKSLNVTIVSHLFNGSMSCLFPQIGDFVRLAFPHSVFTFHGVSFKHQGTEAVLNSMRNFSTAAVDDVNRLTMEKVGLTKKEFKRYSGEDLIQFGYQLLDIGENGWVDGLILKELNAYQFLIKTRDGNKIIDTRIHKRSDIKDLPLVE